MKNACAVAKQAIWQTKLPYAPKKSPAKENSIANAIGQLTRKPLAIVNVRSGHATR